MTRAIDRRGFARRRFLSAIALAPVFAHAAPESRPRRLAVLSLYDAQSTPAAFDGIMKGLAARGWSEGGRLQVLVRSGAESEVALDEMAREVVAWRPDVILTEGSLGTAFLQRATRTIPIVTSVADPVVLGIAKSLVHPGGNITGLSQGGAETAVKMVDLLRTLVPGLKRLAVFVLSAHPLFREIARHVERAATAAGIEPVPILVQDDAEVLRSLGRLRAQGIQAAYRVYGSEPGSAAAAKVAREAVRARLPMVGRGESDVEAGMLASVENDTSGGPDRQAAIIVQIFLGANPADIPFQFPDRFRVVVNRQTARAIGLALPPEILLRADRVIE